ncbi:MAG TPA: glutaredoxin domain-containing protein [Acidimicrobiales bacterium]|nr:glutaredoxin domain-containing protein [Acidimicrobiales bacterium]
MSDGARREEHDEVLEVFWRPGCPYCYRLLDALEAARVRFRAHNIWEDETARAIVAAINSGNETVPTIVIGDLSATNPEPGGLLDTLRAEHPGLFSPAEVG